MKPYVDEVWVWLALVPGVIFVFGAYFIWEGTYRISVGHNHAGMLAWIDALCFDLVMAFAPQYTYIVLPFFMTGVAIWVGYAAGWVYFHPIPVQHLHNAGPRSGRLEPPPFELPASALLDYLAQPMEKRSWWFSREFKLMAFVGGIFWLGAFGFYRTTVHIAEGNHRVAAAYEQAAGVYSQLTQLEEQIQQSSVINNQQGEVRKNDLQKQINELGTLIAGLAESKLVTATELLKLRKRYDALVKQNRALRENSTIIVAPQPGKPADLPGGRPLPSTLRKTSFSDPFPQDYSPLLKMDSVLLWAKSQITEPAGEDLNPN